MKSVLILALSFALLFQVGCSTPGGSETETRMPAHDDSLKFGNVSNQAHLLYVMKLCSIVDAVQGAKKGECLKSYNGVMQSKFDIKAFEPTLLDLTNVVCDQIPSRNENHSYDFVRYYCLRNAFAFATPKDASEDFNKCGSVVSEHDSTAKNRGDCFRAALERLTIHQRSAKK